MLLKKIALVLMLGLLGVLAWRGAHSGSPSPSPQTVAPSEQSVAAPSVSATRAEDPSSSSSSSAPSSPVTSVQGPPPPTDTGSDDEGQAVSTDTPPPTPHADNGQQEQLWKQAVGCAEGFMKAAATGRTLSEQQWWPKVKPYLSEQAQKSWKGYGSRVPFSKVIGQGVPMPLDGTPASEDLPVWVKTDTGAWIVHTATGPDGTQVVSVESAGEGASR